MDDEFGGKSKVEAKRLKEITSKEYFNLREPYGRKNIRLKRLAVLAGTSNDEMLLNDPTGNRRILPVNVLSINKELYNSIDKKALIMEAFKLYESGFEWELNEEDVELLNSNTEEFNQIRPERELILRYFRKSLEGEPDTELMQSMEIKAYVEQCSGQRLSVIKFAQELKSLNFEFKFQDIDGNKARVYFVKKNEPDYVLTSEGVEKQNVENYQIKMPL
jgi:predicted P-loop ATPase